MKKVILTLAILLTVSGCSAVGGALVKEVIGGGGGPSLNVDAQVGKENTKQVVGQQERRTVIAGDSSTVTVTERKEKVAADTVETIVVNERTPPWIWLLLVVGWIAPSPNEIGRFLRGLVKRGD